MKRIFFFIAIAFLTLSSCKKEASTSSKDNTVALSQSQTSESSSGSAVPFHGSYDVIRDGQLFCNSCTNEQATVYGSEQVVFHGLSNGPKSTITFNVNIPGTIKAVGESGRQYTINEHLVYQESNFSNGVFTTKLVSTIRWITVGGSNNFIVTETFYIKVDAAENTTVIRDPVSGFHCQ